MSLHSVEVAAADRGGGMQPGRRARAAQVAGVVASLKALSPGRHWVRPRLSRSERMARAARRRRQMRVTAAQAPAAAAVRSVRSSLRSGATPEQAEPTPPLRAVSEVLAASQAAPEVQLARQAVVPVWHDRKLKRLAVAVPVAASQLRTPRLVLRAAAQQREALRMGALLPGLVTRATPAPRGLRATGAADRAQVAAGLLHPRPPVSLALLAVFPAQADREARQASTATPAVQAAQGVPASWS